MVNGVELLDGYIAELEAKLNLQAGEAIPAELLAASEGALPAGAAAKKQGNKKKEKKATNNNNQKKEPQGPNLDQPEICQLEFKVGQIVKVWVHPKADKLYCEEIDVGEDAPREIASGLRPHFTEEQMLGQRLLVMSNLKPKNLVGFKSNGMVLWYVHYLNEIGQSTFLNLIQSNWYQTVPKLPRRTVEKRSSLSNHPQMLR